MSAAEATCDKGPLPADLLALGMADAYSNAIASVLTPAHELPGSSERPVMPGAAEAAACRQVPPGRLSRSMAAVFHYLTRPSSVFPL